MHALHKILVNLKPFSVSMTQIKTTYAPMPRKIRNTSGTATYLIGEKPTPREGGRASTPITCFSQKTIQKTSLK